MGETAINTPSVKREHGSIKKRGVSQIYRALSPPRRFIWFALDPRPLEHTFPSSQTERDSQSDTNKWLFRAFILADGKEFFFCFLIRIHSLIRKSFSLLTNSLPEPTSQSLFQFAFSFRWCYLQTMNKREEGALKWDGERDWKGK